MSRRIEDYALIGDCETAALVARDGAIDWLCLPRFDSGACFAALLGDRDNGRWTIAPSDPNVRVGRRYRPGTLILETEFATASGTATLVDFMPVGGAFSHLVRLVRGKRGTVELATELVLRFDYGSMVPWVTRLDRETLRAIAGPDMVVVRTTVELVGHDLATEGRFAVAAGETVAFVMSYAPSHLPLPAPIDPERALADTEAYWRRWSGRCVSAGRWSDAVQRSLITLKALTFRATGGIVAAPTTSLPERIGGTRNWDYRYCWLRDATFTLQALMNAGFDDEALAWRAWLLRAVAGSPAQLQVLYGIAGERRIPELEVPWLAGYEGSRPVRIGNAAAGQLQIDVYGEIMDALHVARRRTSAADPAAWALQRALIEHLEATWSEPDEGIWEVRGTPRHFTHSKVMAWVAFDRAVVSAERFQLDGPVVRWRTLRATIHAEICRKGFDPARGTFTQSYGSRAVDASLLLMPLVGFLSPEDPRIRGTLRAIERELVRDGLVLRYDGAVADDGLPAGEGAFLACSFWLADNYLLQGRRADAERLFERLLGLANDVGLLAEEYDPQARRQLGNFPQAFSHIALVNTAHNLALRETPAEQRSGVAVSSAG